MHKQLQETKEKAAEYRRLYGQSQTSSRASSQANSQPRCTQLSDRDIWCSCKLRSWPCELCNVLEA